MKKFTQILLASVLSILTINNCGAQNPKETLLERSKSQQGISSAKDFEKDDKVSDEEKILNDLQEKLSNFENYVDEIKKQSSGKQTKKLKKAQRDLKTIKQELEEYKQKLNKLPAMKEELVALDKKLEDLKPNLLDLGSKEDQARLKNKLVSNYGGQKIQIVSAQPRKRKKHAEDEDLENKLDNSQKWHLMPGPQAVHKPGLPAPHEEPLPEEK